jgi:hypothetical protein
MQRRRDYLERTMAATPAAGCLEPAGNLFIGAWCESSDRAVRRHHGIERACPWPMGQSPTQPPPSMLPRRRGWAMRDRENAPNPAQGRGPGQAEGADRASSRSRTQGRCRTRIRSSLCRRVSLAPAVRNINQSHARRARRGLVQHSRPASRCSSRREPGVGALVVGPRRKLRSRCCYSPSCWRRRACRRVW